MWLIILLPIIVSCICQEVCSVNSFYISFQPQSLGATSPSNKQWIEFQTEFSDTKELTNCQWIRTKYFNLKVAVQLWSYCILESLDGKLICLVLRLRDLPKSGNRDLKMILSIDEDNKMMKSFEVDVNNFFHRTWVNFCVTMSTIEDKTSFYYNGILIGRSKGLMKHNDTILKDSATIYDSSLIFGQEPDIIRGGFDPFQAFMGDLAEFNLWKSILSEIEIRDIANCNYSNRGDVIAWKKGKIVLHKVFFQNIDNENLFCKMEKRFFIFPKRQNFVEAKRTCRIHGASLAVPKNMEENSIFLDILQKQRSVCTDKGKDAFRNGLWLGAIKQSHSWYEIRPDNVIGETLNYSNFIGTSQGSDVANCAILKSDGGWQEGSRFCTNYLALCPLCAVTGTPIFTIKGLDYIHAADYNYYMVLDEKHRISYLEGYRVTNIAPLVNQEGWNIVSKDIAFQKNTGAAWKTIYLPNYAIGRQNVSGDNRYPTLTISQCNFKTKFTCTSGTCINRNRRCDGRRDCMDGSDEIFCDLVEIPSLYRKTDPPSNLLDTQNLEMLMAVEVISVDSINTVEMSISLTAEIQIKWNDQRLRFFNLHSNHENFLPKTHADQIWNPFEGWIIENAVIGGVKYDHRVRTKVIPTIEQDFDPIYVYEGNEYNGSYNFLEISQAMKLTYNCHFDLYKFPFDKQSCPLDFKLFHRPTTNLTFVADGPILYNGSNIINQFRLDPMNRGINQRNTYTMYTLMVSFKRAPSMQLQKTFLPIFLMGILGYSTLFVNMDRLDVRFSGALTTILVQAAWINVINGDLPTTSYLKLIDFWFTWHLSQTFLVILYHVILHKLHTRSMSLHRSDIDHLHGEMIENDLPTIKDNPNIQKFNKLCMIILLFVNCLFYVIYFSFSLVQN